MLRLLPAFLFLFLCALLTFSVWQSSEPTGSDTGRAGNDFPDISHITASLERDTSGPMLVNFFASWCTPCIAEMPYLQKIHEANPSLTMIGIAWKDEQAKLEAWMARHGNPFHTVHYDNEGALGIYAGIKGLPETFLVSSKGTILFHHRGPLLEDDVPIIASYLSSSSAP